MKNKEYSLKVSIVVIIFLLAFSITLLFVLYNTKTSSFNDDTRKILDAIFPEFLGGIWSGFIIFLFLFLVGKPLESYFNNEPNEQVVLHEELISKLSKNYKLLEAGIFDYHDKFPQNLLSDSYSKAIKSIKILHTWLESNQPIPDGIFDSAQRGVDVTIILINPSCLDAQKRTSKLGFGLNSQRPVVLFEGVINSIKKRDIDRKIKLYTIDDIPPFSVYAVDELVIMGFYWTHKGSISSPHLELSTRYEKFTNHVFSTFNNYLQEATRVKIE